MSEKLTSLLAACAITALGLALAAPAVAAPSPVVVTATSEDIPVRYVSYRDLNLAQPDGEKRLVRRVSSAVKNVCIDSSGGDPAARAALNRLKMNDCRDYAWAGAQPQIERAVQRAREIAQNGWSSIAPVAISISVE